MRVLVIGGRGYVGRPLVAALAGAGCAVEVAGRRGPGLVLDPADPATFGALAGFDAAIDVSGCEGPGAEALAGHCLRRGPALICATADGDLLRRLLALDPGAAPAAAVVAGAGLFPGLADLAHAALGGGPARLEAGVQLDPLSGAGDAMVALMARLLTRPRPVLDQGAAGQGPPLGESRLLPFPSGPRPAFAVGLADALLARARGGAGAAWLATRPGVRGARLARLAGYAGRLLPTRGPAAAALRWALTRGLALVRGRLLRRRPTQVEIVALRTDAEGARGLAFCAPDGRAATALLLAATALEVLHHPPPPGLLLPGDAAPLDRVLARVRELGGPGVLRVEPISGV